MRQAFPWEGNQSPGERMAERLATRAKPALAAEAQAARGTGMMAIDGTTRTDEQRRAEARAIVERDGRLAAQQDRRLAEPSQAPAQDGRTIADRMAGKVDKPPQTAQQKRQAEALEKIRASRDRERQDREQGKDRGRGR
jgi:hypothetical protein